MVRQKKLTTIIFLGCFTFVVVLVTLFPRDRIPIPYYLRCEKGNWVNKKRDIYQDLLRKWNSLAKEENISYVLSGGTLLGQFWRGDMIPWDRDADVYIRNSDFKKLQKLASPRNFLQGEDDLIHVVVHEDYMVEPTEDQKRYTCYGELVPKIIDECSFIGPAARLLKGNEYLDIFGLEITEDGSTACDRYKEKYFQTSDIFPAKDCLFMDIQTKCPKNSRNILDKLYSSLEPLYNFCENGRWVKKKL